VLYTNLLLSDLTWLVRKLEEWGEDDGFGPMSDSQDATSVNHNNRVVVLKHLFTLQGLEEDASLLLDLKEDVREECASLGEVTNVVLYDVNFFSFFPSSSFSS
jgi:HIV Tat-specific factor 1